MSGTVCPFCKGAVSADLLRFGGKCPHCILEIPGEEAPTDPGLEQRRKQEAEAAVKAAADKRRSSLFSAAAFTGLFLIISGSGVAFFQLRGGEEAAVMEMEDYYQVDLSTLPTAPSAGPDVKVAVAAGKPVAPRNGTPAARPSGRDPAVPSFLRGDEPVVTGTSVDPTAGAGGGAVGLKGSSATADASLAMTGPAAPSAGAAPSLSLSTGPTVNVSRPSMDVVLSDDQQIYDMAKSIISSSGRQLQTCYDQRLKQNESLKGKWKLEFVIGKDGLPKKVAVTGLTMKDAELESCMVRSVSGWRFQRIARDQPIAKTYGFGPSF